MKKQETNLQKFINFMVHAFIHVGIMTSIILTLFGICYNIIQGENMYIVKIATTIVSAVFLSYIVSAITTSKQLKNMDLKIEEKLKAVIKDTLSKEHENLSDEHGRLSKEHEGLSGDHKELLRKHEEITEAHINHKNDINNVKDSISMIKEDFIKPIFEETRKSGDVDAVSKDLYSNFNIIKNEIQNISFENLKLQEYQKEQLQKQEKLLKDNNDLKLQIKFLEEKQVNINKDITNLEEISNENKSLIVKVDELIENNGKLTSDLDNFKKANENLKIDNTKLKNQNIELNKKIGTLQKSTNKKKYRDYER